MPKTDQTPLSAWRRIVRGIRWSPKYGSHPGTPWALFFIGLGAVAGGWIGAFVMAAVFGPLYLWGAYETGGHDAWED